MAQHLWIQVGMNAIRLVLVFIFCGPINQQTYFRGGKIDYIGLFLYTSGLLILLLGPSYGGTTFACSVNQLLPSVQPGH
jgi:hypothetical protein